MIRFSAALVAVAIGVLIGGIATSELLLVYIAIVVSAVALVALAIGVVLKREELFGEGRGLMPAAAGVGPVLPGRAGESQDKVRAGTYVVPPPPSAGAAAGYAPVVGAAAAPSAPRTAPAGQGRLGDPVSTNTASASPLSANTVPPWESQGAPGPRPPLAADWMSPGQGDRAAGATAGRAASAWQDTASPVTKAGWSLPDADAQAAAPAPGPWAPKSSPPVPAGTPDVKPTAGSGSATPSWFDRLGGQASTAARPSAAGAPATQAPPTVSTPPVSTPPVSTPAGAPPPVPGGKVAGDTESGDPVADQTVPGNTVPGNTVPGNTVPGNTVPGNTVPGNTVPGNTGASDDDDDWPTRYSWLDDESGEDEEEASDAETTSPATADADTGSDVPSAAGGEAAPVTVVPGVPRYHRPDCVLVRFMPDGDVQKLPVAQAKDAGCTPCAACQPEG